MTVEHRLIQLRNAVRDARAVPMSASCMLNRQEVLDFLEATMQELQDELAEAQAIVEQREQERMRGRNEGIRIRNEAEEWAEATANNTEVVRRAQEKADFIVETARQEAAALRQETDAFVDQRMAEFEAALQKTQSQVALMRAKLASRSDLDNPDTGEINGLA